MAFSILVAGATGMIGSEVLRQALADLRVDRGIALVRRPIGSSNPKLVEWIAGENDLLSGLKAERADAVICCLGTTIRTVGGDKSKFIHVDKDLVLGLGRWAKEQNARTFAVVSAVGADPGSRVFYSRVKGEMEEGLRAVGVPRTLIFQPSILTGPRKEVRFAERAGIAVMTVFSPLMVGALAMYRPMPSGILARAMLNACSREDGATGVRILRYRDIRSLAER